MKREFRRGYFQMRLTDADDDFLKAEASRRGFKKIARMLLGMFGRGSVQPIKDGESPPCTCSLVTCQAHPYGPDSKG